MFRYGHIVLEYLLIEAKHQMLCKCLQPSFGGPLQMGHMDFYPDGGESLKQTVFSQTTHL